MKIVKQIVNIYPQARQGFGEEIEFLMRPETGPEVTCCECFRNGFGAAFVLGIAT